MSLQIKAAVFPPKILGPYHARKRVSISFKGRGRTKQSMKDECDINLIMAKYQTTGAIAHVNKFGASYGFATSQDFTEAMRTVVIAQDMFNGLPSSIRSRFGNDPAAFLEFVQDSENHDELVKLGLFSPGDEALGERGSEPKASEDPEPKASEEKSSETASDGS